MPTHFCDRRMYRANACNKEKKGTKKEETCRIMSIQGVSFPFFFFFFWMIHLLKSERWSIEPQYTSSQAQLWISIHAPCSLQIQFINTSALSSLQSPKPTRDPLLTHSGTVDRARLTHTGALPWPWTWLRYLASWQLHRWWGRLPAPAAMTTPRHWRRPSSTSRHSGPASSRPTSGSPGEGTPVSSTARPTEYEQCAS